MMLWTLLFACVGLSFSSSRLNLSNRNLYHGRYNGKCGSDGFYYQNEFSFMMCSNGYSFEQRCAPGSKNSGYGNYKSGGNYNYRDFCDVNLVDHGYGVNKGYGPDKGYGYANNARGYGPDKANRYDNNEAHGQRDNYRDRDSYGYEEGYERKPTFGNKAGYEKQSHVNTY